MHALRHLNFSLCAGAPAQSTKEKDIDMGLDSSWPLAEVVSI